MNNPDKTDWELLLTETERAQMLQEIGQVGLAVGRHLFADGLRDDLDISAGSLKTHKSPVERLGFIARTLPPLADAIEQIVCVPLSDAHAQTRRVSPPERARRLDTQSLMRSVQSGDIARGAFETVTSLTTDTPENRSVHSFLNILRRDAQTIQQMAEAWNESEITQTAWHCSQRLLGLSRHLGTEVAHWDHLTAWLIPPTHRMLSQPTYARVSGWMRQYRQNFGFDWDMPLFRLPARETWRLYETWGLFQVLQALLTLGFAPEAASLRSGPALLLVKQDRLLFRLMKGEESGVALQSPQGRRFRLYYNRSYPALRRSLSRTMQPDIALEDEAGRTWVLDPKFKGYAVPGEEGDDIDQMHAYRDAIVDTNGVKSVQRAWCLFAGRADSMSRPMIAYGPPASSVVGALCLRPGQADGFTHLCNLLASWGVV